MDITVGARGSPLSQRQVAEVQKDIARFYPLVHLTPVWITTCGDVDRTTPLWKVSASDFFTHEIDQKLLQNEIRLAVHSAKDLPSPIPEGLSIIALTKGVDPRDSLVMNDAATVETLPPNAKIGTSSKRRTLAIQTLRPDLQIVDVRGTIEERLALLRTGQIDGVVIAEAALIRLHLTHLNRLLLDHETEPLQGKLAVVARTDDQEMSALFAAIDTRKRIAVVGPSIPNVLRRDPAVAIRHMPLIHLTPLPVATEDLQTISTTDGVILTSKHAASFLHDALQTAQIVGKPSRCFCVGSETAAAAHACFPESEILSASEATQEGVVDLIITVRPRRLLWPRSTHARKCLPQALAQAGIGLLELPLYSPVQTTTPCSLEGIDAVFFTCPSSVDAFFSTVSRKLWEPLALKAIGPVTFHRLAQRLAAFDCHKAH